MSTAKATTDAAAISKQLDYLARALKARIACRLT